jgi:hypothetical protein
MANVKPFPLTENSSMTDVDKLIDILFLSKADKETRIISQALSNEQILKVLKNKEWAVVMAQNPFLAFNVDGRILKINFS